MLCPSNVAAAKVVMQISKGRVVIALYNGIRRVAGKILCIFH